MAGLYILILSVLPICFAQFSIQGPSDGNRAAQGLKYSEEKGIEYTDQRESLGTGDFSIQGATDGNSNFQIQGASDGNTDFQIQGATDGNSNFQIQGATDGNSDFKIQGATDGNANFQIQGATDGNANFQIQGATDGNYESSITSPYDANQGAQRSLQYNDPNGFKLNWRSYAHGQLSPQSQPQPQPQPAYTPRQPEPRYEPEPAPQPAARPAPQRNHESEPEESPQAPISYRPYDNAPVRIKQLLQFQQQIPYLNAIPEHLRYDSLATAQPQAQHDQAPQEPPQRAAAPPQQYRSKSRAHQRSKRQAQQQQQQQQQQHQAQREAQQLQQQYRRIPQPAPERLPQYSTNVPAQIKQLIQFQSQIPYLNAIPEQFRYNLDSPPAPVQPYQSPGIAQPQKVPRGGHQRSKRQAHQQRQQPPQQQYKRIPQPAPEAQPQYSTNVPAQIKQLLQFQSQIPYVNAIPEQFRYNLENVKQHATQNAAESAHQRGKREAQQHQGQPQQQYRRISEPAPEVQPQYSTNLPSGIQQILQFQAQTPYNIIANQITYKLDKPYVPQRVSPPNSNYAVSTPAAGYQSQGHGDVKPVTEYQ